MTGTMCTSPRSIPRTMNAGRNVQMRAQHTAWSARHSPTTSPPGRAPRTAIPPSRHCLSDLIVWTRIRHTRRPPSRVQSIYYDYAERITASTQFSAVLCAARIRKRPPCLRASRRVAACPSAPAAEGRARSLAWRVAEAPGSPRLPTVCILEPSHIKKKKNSIFLPSVRVVVSVMNLKGELWPRA